jgi:hypothetical protein
MDYLSLVNLKLKGVKASAQRARVAFFITILAACAVGISLYNDHLAWSRRLLDPHRGFTSPQTSPLNSAGQNSKEEEELMAALSREKRVEIIRNWEDSTNIQLDLLGIKLGSGDLTFFGSIAMLVVSIYSCLCFRRGREDVQSVLGEITKQDATQPDEQLRNYVLAGIRQSLVLTVVEEKEEAMSQESDPRTPRLLRLVRQVLSFLTYAPTIAIAAILLGDIAFAVPDRLWVLQHLQREYLFQFIVLDLVGLVLMIFVWNINRLTNRFQSLMADSIVELASQRIVSPGLKADSMTAGGR